MGFGPLGLHNPKKNYNGRKICPLLYKESGILVSWIDNHKSNNYNILRLSTSDKESGIRVTGIDKTKQS